VPARRCCGHPPSPRFISPRRPLPQAAVSFLRGGEAARATPFPGGHGVGSGMVAPSMLVSPHPAGQSCCGAGAAGTAVPPAAAACAAARHVSRRAIRARSRVPDARPVGVRGDRVDVVAEELEPEVVLARRARITDRAAKLAGERAHRAVAGDVRVLDDADESARARGVVPERGRERLVDEVGVRASRRDRDRGVVAAIARRLRRRRNRPRLAAVGRGADEDVLAPGPVAPVDPATDDLVRCANSGRRAVRDVDARRGREIVAAPRRPARRRCARRRSPLSP
jgi:hypothetical protein